MKKKIKIKLNGKLKAINNNSTLFNIVQKNKIPLAKVAIELNQEIVDKKKIKSINLKNNDKLKSIVLNLPFTLIFIFFIFFIVYKI